MVFKYIFIFLTGISFLQLKAQQRDSTSDSLVSDSINTLIIEQLELNDIGFVWSGKLSEENRLGFIGPEYQRIIIDFTSVIQNFDNPFEYFVYGSSSVSANVCNFLGSILITEAGYIPDQKYPEFVRGFITGNYVFFEDQSCLHSGIFRGEFITSFYIDKEGTLYYDNLEDENSDFTNNEFFGVWENYTGEISHTCNWGDHRIPFAGDLDVGLNEFSPSFKYIDNGWREYLNQQKEKE